MSNPTETMEEQEQPAADMAANDDEGPPPAFPLVAIGASAGGVMALQRLFECLPDDSGAAFVVIIHLDPERESGLAQILGARTAMPVVQVTERTELKPNAVYVIPPNRQLHVDNREISTSAFEEPRGQRAPIDQFFRSLAYQHGDGFAIILSGAGSDGAIGVKAVKEAGGIILVQDPQEAEYASMPRSSIATGVADIVLPIRELAEQLVQLIGNKVRLRRLGSPEGEHEVVRRILAYLRTRSGHDFSKYKRSTVVRRLTRRMHIARRENLEEYHQYLRATADEVQRLFGDLLISVTTFFRDPDTFQVLADEIIPRLFKNKDSDDCVRVWVPGCATGEEAYSIVMLLLEEAGRRDLRPDIQVFASDLDGAALAMAREGRYPAVIETDVSAERLKRFFHREGQHFRVRREVRDLVLFATHSLLKDPPFSRLDLISCRNLLIYLDRDLQQQALTTCNYALLPGGFLFLGSSENADSPPGLFRAVNRSARIYEPVERAGGHPVIARTILAPRLHDWQGPRGASALVPNEANLHRRALEEQAPPSVLVDETYNVVHISESAGRFLQHSSGRLKSDLSELIRPEMRVDLRIALDRAFEQGQASLSLPIPVRFNGTPQRVYLQVRPVARQDAPRAALVLFIEGGLTDVVAEGRPAIEDAGGDDTVQQLREQLHVVRERLKTSREEEEAANEELRAANEELQSINEEYRSTAEELETSKEELQSINEELQTLNNELKLKLDGVSRAHNDLQNLMAATDVGTLFLDSALRIKRFTPRVADLFNVTSNDQGRPITDFTHRLDYDGLPADAGMVLQTLVPIEREVQSTSGSWYLMRLRPYRTMDDKIEGVVVTFVDVTERRQAEDSLRINERRLKLAREASDLGIVDYTPSNGECWLNDRARALWGFTETETVSIDQFWSRLHPDDLAAAKTALAGALVPAGDGLYAAEFRVRPIRDGDNERWVRGNGKVFFMEDMSVERLVVTVQDVSDRIAWTRQRLLLSELSHRVKNTLAVVQSLARQSFRGAKDQRQALASFEGRLGALSLAHELLVKNDWQGAELEEVARQQLGAQLFENDSVVKLDGPQVMLPPRLATPFGLLLHELGTNAIKYGSLSKPTGTVTLTWRLLLQDDGRVLHVEWREVGGPPPKKGIKPGFGSYLVQHGLPGAKVEREFASEGLRCDIELPLTGSEH